MAKQVIAVIDLTPRPSDLPLRDEEFLKASLFRQLKTKPSLDRFPGALVLRRFRAGEAICRQGEAGWTAFSILPTEDALEMLRLVAARTGGDALAREIASLEDRARGLAAGPGDQNERWAATVHLAIPRKGPERRGFLERLFNRSTSPARPAPASIPIDGPADVDYQSLEARIHEGELFGEMSCLYRVPRSATVVARRDCYVLEMLRTILEQLQKDPVYKKQTEELYRRRVLQLQLRNLSIFSDLDDALFARIRDSVELVSYDAGQILCEEHEPSDCMYLIRSGLVKVVAGASSLLDGGAIADWPALLGSLRAPEPAAPRLTLRSLLPEAIRSTTEPDRQTVLDALNRLIQSPVFADTKEFQGLLAEPAVQGRLADLPAKRQDWSESDRRRAHRVLLERLLDGLRPLPPRQGLEHVLTYCSRGDFLGEIGLMLGTPRTATCIAYGHPTEDGAIGRVEAVRIPAAMFREMVDASPAIRARVEAECQRRQKRSAERAGQPAWAAAPEPLLSETGQRLGLIQGQRLMLIDLDRCTRCDECVQACVHTHPDRRSRLFLDGPRFGKYLVPTTCRSCLDPVCMIGCPVGSIHRGDNGQIIIEDWCIGCGKCAENCPYGSIWMHDVGIIPEEARGWRWLPEAQAPDGSWVQPGYNDRRWLEWDGPIWLDRGFRQALAARGLEQGAAGGAFCFRLGFFLGPDQLGSRYRLELGSADAEARAWMNGSALTPEKAQRGRQEFSLTLAPTGPLRPGRNVVAVRARSTGKPGEEIVKLRLDAVPQAPAAPGEEVSVKLATELAVVCDLCSNLAGQRPACVNACPHEAAMRVDARQAFGA